MYAFEKPYTLDIGKYFCLAGTMIVNDSDGENLNGWVIFLILIQDGIFTKLWVGFGAFLKMKIPFGFFLILSGWLWTSRDNFPFFYSEKHQNWFFIDLSITDLTGWFLYEFSVEQWKHLKFAKIFICIIMFRSRLLQF